MFASRGRATLLGLVLPTVIGACSRSAPVSPPARATTPAASIAAPPPCGAMPPALESYAAIRDGVPFSLVVARDERGAWAPASQLDMPMHHASMITWTDDAGALDDAAARVTVVATGLGRLSLEADEERHVFFATYGARVDRVCAAP